MLLVSLIMNVCCLGLYDELGKVEPMADAWRKRVRMRSSPYLILINVRASSPIDYHGGRGFIPFSRASKVLIVLQ